MQISAMLLVCVILFVAVLHSGLSDLTSGSCPVLDEPWTTQISPSTIDLFDAVTAPCHYDKLKPPELENGEPLRVYIRAYFYFLKSYEAHNLQFTVYMLLQFRFHDPRLQFDPEVYNASSIVGTKEMSRRLWTPHTYLHNERQSTVMGPASSDIMVHIVHDGTVLVTKRIQTTLFCWMKLQKFPFDSQECSLVLDSWSYNMTYLTLEWEQVDPILCREELTLTEFSLVGEPKANMQVENFDFDNGDFQGNYSALVVTFNLQRESGFYIYDYFIPSILLVMISWVSFWLEAEALPGRVVLGCVPMLTFIILALQTGNSLPKVSYVKASEIWFLACCGFIFGSLVEFAFVNTIWRSRRKRIHLKKVNSKYILKQTLTPKPRRKEFGLERSTSCPNDMSEVRDICLGVGLQRDLHMSSLPNVNVDNAESLKSEGGESQGNRKGDKKASLLNWLRRRRSNSKSSSEGPTLMTPQEVSNWIDQRSRIVFPSSFLVFNLVYWSYINYL